MPQLSFVFNEEDEEEEIRQKNEHQLSNSDEDVKNSFVTPEKRYENQYFYS